MHSFKKFKNSVAVDKYNYSSDWRVINKYISYSFAYNYEIVCVLDSITKMVIFQK